MSKLDGLTYSLMRIACGFLFFWHGCQKLWNYPPTGHASPDYVKWIAGPIEFFGGLLILIGLWTRWPAFLASGLMAVAYWKVHHPKSPLPFTNGGELAVLFCFVFFFIFTHGSGTLSADALWAKGKKSKKAK